MRCLGSDSDSLDPKHKKSINKRAFEAITSRNLAQKRQAALRRSVADFVSRPGALDEASGGIYFVGLHINVGLDMKIEKEGEDWSKGTYKGQAHIDEYTDKIWHKKSRRGGMRPTQVAVKRSRAGEGSVRGTKTT